MIDIERMKIAGKIRTAILEKGVVLSDLAKAHNISGAALQHVINGQRGKTAENAITMALGFDPWVEWIGKKEEPESMRTA